MRLLELWVLFEGKEQYVINTFGPKLIQAYEADPTTAKKEEITAEEITKILAGFDPTPNNKYLVWIAKLYADRQLKSEDLFKLPDELTLFANVQNKLEVKDIMKYSGLPELAKATMEYENQEDQQSNKQKAKSVRQEFIDNGDAVVVYSTPNIKIVQPKTKAASCEFGKGTKWCTASTNSHNYFDDYDELFIVYPKPPVDGGPFQFDIQQPYDDEDGATGSIGMIADVYDGNVELKEFLDKVPAARKFMIQLLNDKRIEFRQKKEYEALFGKKFSALPRKIRAQWLMNTLMHKINYTYGSNSKFIEEFHNTFNEKQRFGLFRKHKSEILSQAGNRKSPRVIMTTILTFFGQSAVDSMTEQDVISNGRMYRRSGDSSQSLAVPTAIKQYQKFMPNFNVDDVYRAAAKSLLNTDFKNDGYDILEAFNFIESAMKFKKDRAAVMGAYEDKKVQMQLAKMISTPDALMRSETYGTPSSSMELIGRNILSDPDAINFLKEKLQDIFRKVKAKVKLVAGRDNPTQKSIKIVYGFIDSPSVLRTLSSHEVSVHDSAAAELEQIGIPMSRVDNGLGDFHNKKLSLNWTFEEEEGTRILNQLSVARHKIPDSKQPAEKYGMTFAYAAKNSIVLIYRARGRSWLLQIPYTGKLTNSGLPGFDPTQAKLYDAETINVADNVRQDINHLLKYIQSETGNLTIDTSNFVEGRGHK